MERLVIGNMKMNILSPLERVRYLDLLRKELNGQRLQHVQLVLCPPFVHLEEFKKSGIKKIKVGAQNMFWERKGAFTGEISPAMLKNAGCEYVILGHSERRRYFTERDEEINLKLTAALKEGLKPILCVGEDKSQKSNSAAVITGQLRNCLAKVSRPKMENVVICYEPVWAISANHPDHLPTTDEIMSARLLIKKFLVGQYGAKTAEKVKIIYGGSVNASTAGATCLDSGMEGALIGQASLTPYEFIKLAKVLNR